MVSSPTRFTDIRGHWAEGFIQGLAERGIVRGFPDQTFRPNQPMSRAEFAAILRTAFATAPQGRSPLQFVDVPTNHWAGAAIQFAYAAGFVSGYPNQHFRPDEKIIRVHGLIALVSGLNLNVPEQTNPAAFLSGLYQDGRDIPAYAQQAVAIATLANLVVNHPDITRLNPQRAATRAEITAFIYQALVRLQQFPALSSGYIVRHRPSLSLGHTREFRAAWLTSVWNIDWPSRAGLPAAQQQAELIAILDQLKSLNFNALIFQVRPEGDALYPSELEPWSSWLSGTQGQPPQPYYDPLEFVITQAHQRNIEVHAWFNPYRARARQQTVNVRPHMAATHPEFVYEWGTQLWMDPGVKVVQDRAYSVILDVVRRYDVDGIHLDDYFYPYPITGKSFPDDRTYQSYRNSGGSLALADWRRNNVNQLIQRLATGIRAAKPYVKFGISPFGIYRPGQPAQIQGLDAYESLYADSLKWLQEGWLDYCSPQLYWRIDPPAQSYPVLLKWWAENNPKRRHIYPGNNLGQLDGQRWPLLEIERQVDLTRQLRSQLATGNIFFSMKAFSTNREGISDRFKTATFAQAVLPPAMDWLTADPPVSPVQFQGSGGKLTWRAGPSSTTAWTLYHQTNSGWTLQRILPPSQTELSAAPGSYALCAVNRLSQESAAITAVLP